MAALQFAPARQAARTKKARAPKAAKPTTEAQALVKLDVAALFEDTMRRYPATMARLAE